MLKEIERIGFDGLNAEHVVVTADFGSDSDDDYWKNKHLEKEDEQLRQCRNRTYLPSPNDNEISANIFLNYYTHKAMED